jgi:uncharacterized protein (DUF1697 family)
MKYITLLRGINVAGHKTIKMDMLIEMCNELGFISTETYLQSGNLIIQSDLTSEEISETLTYTIEQTFGYEGVAAFTYTPAEFADLIESNPFTSPACEQSKVYYTFIHRPIEPGRLRIAKNGFLPDRFHIDPRMIYVHCPKGYGRTKLSNRFFERKFKLTATTRNSNTVHELLKRCS